MTAINFPFAAECAILANNYHVIGARDMKSEKPNRKNWYFYPGFVKECGFYFAYIVEKYFHWY